MASLTPLLRFAGWLLCIEYASVPLFWFMVHPHAEYWRSWKRSPYWVILPSWMGIWIVLGLLTFKWRHVALYSTPWTWIPVVILFAIGYWLYTRAKVSFSPAQLGGLPELRPDEHEQRLVTTGIRAHVRHPVYLGHFCEMLGWSIGTGLVVCFVLTAFAIVTGAIMIRIEDGELEKRFGEEYARYKKKVPAVWPSVCR